MLARIVALTTALSLLLAAASAFASTSASASGPNTAPTIAQTIAPGTIQVKGASRLEFTITNPNVTALTNVAFTDPLPQGVGVFASPQFSTDCGGQATYATNAGITTIKLINGTIPGSDFCKLAINITGLSAGVKTNTSTPVTSNEAQDSLISTATLTVTPAFVGGLQTPPRTTFLPIPGFPLIVKFTVGGNQGLGILEEAKSRQVDCRTHDPLGSFEPANKFLGLYFYTPFVDAYNYFWATKPVWFGTCREFVIVLTTDVEINSYVAFTFDVGQFP